MGYLFQGRIFWHEVEDRRGQKKRRPLVIISSSADVTNPNIDSVICVACSNSTAEKEPLPTGCILLPPKSGKRSTKLPKTTAAVCHWQLSIKKTEITDDKLAGSIGEATLLAVIKLFNHYQSSGEANVLPPLD